MRSKLFKRLDLDPVDLFCTTALGPHRTQFKQDTTERGQDRSAETLAIEEATSLLWVARYT